MGAGTPTVNVGFSTGEDVDDSVTELEDGSVASSAARTAPRRVADEYRTDSRAALRRMFAMEGLESQNTKYLSTTPGCECGTDYLRKGVGRMSVL